MPGSLKASEVAKTPQSPGPSACFGPGRHLRARGPKTAQHSEAVCVQNMLHASCTLKTCCIKHGFESNLLLPLSKLSHVRDHLIEQLGADVSVLDQEDSTCKLLSKKEFLQQTTRRQGADTGTGCSKVEAQGWDNVHVFLA